MSHQTECCQSKFVPNFEQCGWIYDTYGVKITCPKGHYNINVKILLLIKKIKAWARLVSAVLITSQIATMENRFLVSNAVHLSENKQIQIQYDIGIGSNFFIIPRFLNLKIFNAISALPKRQSRNIYRIEKHSSHFQNNA